MACLVRPSWSVCTPLLCLKTPLVSVTVARFTLMLLSWFTVPSSLIFYLHIFFLQKVFVASLTKALQGSPIRAGTDLQHLPGLSVVHPPGPQLYIHSAQLHLEAKLQRHLGRQKEKKNRCIPLVITRKNSLLMYAL